MELYHPPTYTHTHSLPNSAKLITSLTGNFIHVWAIGPVARAPKEARKKSENSLTAHTRMF